jgi:NADH:ubiquinone oxidoreductase subunit 6 (subunit J)
VREILFFLAAFGAIGGALAVVLVRNPFFSVLSLDVHLLALATLFLLLNAEFIAAAQIVVYAGAVMVLYVFVVAYIGGVREAPPIRGESSALGITGMVAAAGLVVVVTIAVVGTGLSAIDTKGADVGTGFGTPGQIGQFLLQKFLVPFEAASILLLVAAIGAVVLARKRRGLPDEFGGQPAGLGTPSGAAPARESDLLGGPEAEETPLPAGTAEAPGDPVPDRGTWQDR